MKLEQSFEVRAPLEHVWETLIDVEHVASCLPGAEIAESDHDGTYHGTFTVKLGPTTAAYRGGLQIEEADGDAHRAVMRATGQDKRGQGSAKATIVSSLRAAGEITHVDVQTDFTITGRLARFGRGGMIKDISNRLLSDFAGCLQARMEAEHEAGGAAADAAAEDEEPAEAREDGAAAAGAPDPTAPAPPLPAPAGPPRGFTLLLGVLVERFQRLMRRWFRCG